MASRRAPLANVPNAVNSPFRIVAATNGKRTRAQLGDVGQGQPPAKRQIIEIKDEDEENVDPRRRSGVAIGNQDKLEEPFSKRSNAPPNAFERRLAAAREKKPATQQSQLKEKTQKPQDGENVEAIRQWQRHYRRQFPTFVMYFDGVPEDVRSETVRKIKSLGAREEKFFSRAVTHVVTTRQIPSEFTNTSPDEDGKYVGAQLKVGQTNTLSQDQKKTASMLDGALQRRNQPTAIVQDIDPRKTQTQGSDILSRARQLGIKIWALEKLHRMLSTILDTDTGEQPAPHGTRSHVAAGKPTARPTKDADLEQLLRNEKVNGPADRDMTVAAQDMSTFSGYYIYIHDMDEKTKPVMIRDYPKAHTKEQGKWPQFRLTGPGRCPFVEDPTHAKRLVQQEAAAKAQDELASRKTRAASAQQAQSLNTRTASLPRELSERQANLRRSPRKLDAKPDATVKPLDPPKQPPTKRQSSAEGTPPLFGSAQQSLRGPPRTIGGEPVASGMQRSNVTSAIQSQFISSAAISSTAPGANHRVGDSKEVSQLKRKVLERGASVTSTHSMPSSHMNDIRAAINNDNEPPPRKAKRKAQDILGVVHEADEYHGEQRPAKQRKPAAVQRRKPVERDPKPGYCENCRDKFEDFDEHCQSRKHRKFAMTQDNWKELDALLSQLKRPHKQAC